MNIKQRQILFENKRTKLFYLYRAIACLIGPKVTWNYFTTEKTTDFCSSNISTFIPSPPFKCWPKNTFLLLITKEINTAKHVYYRQNLSLFCFSFLYIFSIEIHVTSCFITVLPELKELDFCTCSCRHCTINKLMSVCTHFYALVYSKASMKVFTHVKYQVLFLPN